MGERLGEHLVKSGKINEAWSEMEKPLAEGTEDARLFLHAAVIAAAAGKKAESAEWIAKASAIRQMLFPSENELLQSLTKSMAPNGTVKTVQK